MYVLNRAHILCIHWTQYTLHAYIQYSIYVMYTLNRVHIYTLNRVYILCIHWIQYAFSHTLNRVYIYTFNRIYMYTLNTVYLLRIHPIEHTCMHKIDRVYNLHLTEYTCIQWIEGISMHAQNRICIWCIHSIEYTTYIEQSIHVYNG